VQLPQSDRQHLTRQTTPSEAAETSPLPENIQTTDSDTEEGINNFGSKPEDAHVKQEDQLRDKTPPVATKMSQIDALELHITTQRRFMQTTSSYMRNKSKLGRHVKKSSNFLNEEDPEIIPEFIM
jgi:hypothetical protein